MAQKGPGKAHREGISIMELADMFPNEESAIVWFESVIWPNSGLLMELRATENLKKGTKREADTWFNHAHDAIIETFVGITNKKLQQDVWVLEERN